MKKIFFIFITILVISLPIILAETYLRYIGLGSPITYDSNYVYGYSPKINQKKIRFKNSTITINDVGLRSKYNWNENIDKKKIVFFGDSVTYGGSYIDDNEIFSELVCKKINNPDYICGNAGVNAYGTFNIVFRSRYDDRIKNDDIRIFILVPDDFYRGLQNYNTAHFYMNDQVFLFPAIMEAFNYVSTRYSFRNYISKKLDYKNDKNKKKLIIESIQLLNSEFKRLKQINKKFLVFYSRPKSITEIDNFITSKIFNLINFEIINLSDVLKNEMFKDSIHYNNDGHRAVAVSISNELIKTLK